MDWRQLARNWDRLNQAAGRRQNPSNNVGRFAMMPTMGQMSQPFLSPFEMYAGMMPQQEMPVLPDGDLADNWRPEGYASLMRMIKPRKDMNFAAQKPRKRQGRFGGSNKMKGMIGGRL